MKKDIAIVGIGGTSRDIVDALEAQNDRNPTWNIVGFFDDNPELTGQKPLGYPILGALSSLNRREFDKVSVVIGVANERQLFVRREISHRIGIGPERYPTIIHPAATISKHAQLGAGTVLLSGAFCSNGVVLGNHVIVLQNTIVGHDSHLADFVSVSANVAIAGGVQVEEGAYLGIACSVLPLRKIGRGALVGSGCVVTRDVPAEAVVFGNPGRIIAVGESQERHSNGDQVKDT